MDAVERTLWLCDQPSVTGRELPLTRALESAYRDAGEDVVRVRSSVVVGGGPGGRPLLLLVGHLDTVPPTDADEEARIEERNNQRVVVGRGASDMKSGVAVAEAIFADAEIRADGRFDLALVLYAGEEGPAEGNELADVLRQVPWLSSAALAIVLEPTDLEVQVGCTGSVQGVVEVSGRQAHSARPWTGQSALTNALPLLAAVAEREPVDVEVDGIGFRDVLSATQIWTDNPKNVVPGRVWVNLNLRFAPSRGLAEAQKQLVDWVGDRGQVEIVDLAPPAPPFLDHPLVTSFVEIVDRKVTGKQGWTDVARLAQAGIPALNFGPGLTAQAHQSGEYVPIANIEEAAATLRRFVAETET